MYNHNDAKRVCSKTNAEMLKMFPFHVKCRNVEKVSCCIGGCIMSLHLGDLLFLSLLSVCPSV